MALHLFLFNCEPILNSMDRSQDAAQDYQSDEEVIKDQGSPDSSHTDNVGGAWPLIKPKKPNPRRRFMFVCGFFSREPAQRISSGNQLREPAQTNVVCSPEGYNDRRAKLFTLNAPGRRCVYGRLNDQLDIIIGGCCRNYESLTCKW